MSKLEAALELASLGLYVFPCERNDKKPAVKGWQNSATRDPHTIRLWWEHLANGDYNIGISTDKFQDEQALLVLDIDRKNGKDGYASLLALDLQGLELPTTLSAKTPSGGEHLFFHVPKPVRQSANAIGEGLDIRSRGGFVVGVGSSIDDKHYRWNVRAEIAPAPLWLVERCGTPRERPATRSTVPPRVQLDGSRAISRAISYLRDEAPSGEPGALSDTAYRVACAVKDRGISRDQCIGLMFEHWPHSPMTFVDMAERVSNAYRYGLDPPGATAPEADFNSLEPIKTENSNSPQAISPYQKLNREFAFVLAGGGSHILWETVDAYGRQQVIHLDESAFHKKFAAEKIMVGKKEVALTHDWMEWKGRRSYDGVVFQPGAPRDVKVGGE